MFSDEDEVYDHKMAAKQKYTVGSLLRMQY